MGNIQNYIRSSSRDGKSDEEIANNLRAAGWRDDVIDQAFIQVANDPDGDLERSEGTRVNFLYLLSFISVYITVWAFITTAFGVIDSVFSVEIGQAVMERLRWGIASLVVVFPVFLVTNHLIRKTVGEDPKDVHLTDTRKGLTYVTLFVATLIFMISAIRLVYELTGGEFITASIFKILVVIFVAVSLFGYYFNDIKLGEQNKS
ncbi:MAG: DUF5671 domain-containing protein [Candidatus Campbellbacteria bacterium]|nr:DUF5671 domain-containing protein [Candidatus Campbellbacteria bacterium]